jgi:hypothetical protein
MYFLKAVIRMWKLWKRNQIKYNCMHVDRYCINSGMKRFLYLSLPKYGDACLIICERMAV